MIDQNKVYITRRFNHPVELVFKALTDPDSIIGWFGPPNMSTRRATVDLIAGGRYSFELDSPVGPSFNIEGEYKEIDPPRKLVFTLNYVGLPHGQAGESLVTMQLTPMDAGKTELSFKQEFVSIPANMEGRTKAWEAMFDRISSVIISLKN